jgi:hypothetical protein
MADSSPEYDEYFEAAKSIFNGQELSHLDHEAPIEAHADASNHGLGGCLCKRVSQSSAYLYLCQNHRRIGVRLTERHWR